MFRRGFTLVELAAVLAVGSVAAVMVAPGGSGSRMLSQDRGSTNNLLTIAQGSAMYTQDNDGAIHTYTWRAGVGYTMPDGMVRTSSTDQEAANWQNTEILQRRTGRFSVAGSIVSNLSQLAHRRGTHVVLMDYMEVPFPSEIFAEPADENLLLWQSNPLDLSSANRIPYAPGSNVPNGYHNAGGLTETGARQRWAYGTSYERTVSAWNPQNLEGSGYYRPHSSSPHTFFSVAPAILLSHPRRMTDVVFPAAKVEYFEEFDRQSARDPYFGYDRASCIKAMFDGSVNGWQTMDANGAADPSTPWKEVWRQRYVPLHQFPEPLSGLGENTLVSQKMRWTLGGLRGLDYPQPLMGNPNHGRNSR